MTETITLTEYEDKEVSLSETDAEFVSVHLAGKLTIQRSFHEKHFVINSCQYVGVVALPSGIRLECRPKIPVNSLFYMLAVSLQLPTFRRETVQLGRMDEVLEFIVNVFADEVEERLRNGLYRWYVERDANLPALRGRINLIEDLRKNYILRNRIVCKYDDFTWDIPENQIIRQVSHTLNGWGFSSPTRLRLGQIDAELGEITRTQFSALEIDRINYHRLNEEYRPLHQLCRLFLEGASFSEDLGVFNFRAFLVDMNKLFEDFVCQILRQRASGNLSVNFQEWIYLDHGANVLMKPDILIRRGGLIAVAADCKYKKLGGSDRNHDVYQLVSYCTATNTNHGILIYPKHAIESGDPIRIKNSRISVRLEMLDLSRDLAELANTCNRFADRVLALSDDN